jgi:hypothetical protein
MRLLKVASFGVNITLSALAAIKDQPGTAFVPSAKPNLPSFLLVTPEARPSIDSIPWTQ